MIPLLYLPYGCGEAALTKLWKPDSSAFCAVSTMKAPSVKTSDLRNWVEANDQMGMLFGDMTPFLNLPSGLATGEYRRMEMHDLGQCAAYNKLHVFEGTHVWCHVLDHSIRQTGKRAESDV